MRKLNHKTGFTLAELLIVVAIIAVLVAIAIPVFGAQLQKAQLETDTANLRSAYAEVVADYLDNTGTTITQSALASKAGLKYTTPTWASETVTLTHNKNSALTETLKVDSSIISGS